MAGGVRLLFCVWWLFVRVAVVQSPRFSGVRDGLRWLLDVAPRADLYVLPEYWLGTAPVGDFGGFVSAVTEASRSLGGVVVAGALAVGVGGSVRNVCPVVGPEGLVVVGEKIFPSAATGERGRVAGGSRLALFALGGWRVGCLVCVDLLYPELARRLALSGAEALVNPASISVDRVALWEAVAVTRAFENSVYVVSALGVGYSYPDGRPAEGGSLAATPEGELIRFGRGAGVYVVELDRGVVARARARRRYLEDVASMPEVGLNTAGL